MLPDSGWFELLLMLVLVWLVWAWRRPSAQSRIAALTAMPQRLLKPRTPDDCPVCCQQTAPPTPKAPTSTPVTPWCEVKSRRGAPKRIATQGFACPNRTCMYYRITDAQIHALVGDGAEGKVERIQTLRCQ